MVHRISPMEKSPMEKHLTESPEKVLEELQEDLEAAVVVQTSITPHP